MDEQYREDAQLAHIRRLAAEKQDADKYYPLKHYKCCGLIKKNGRYIRGEDRWKMQ